MLEQVWEIETEIQGAWGRLENEPQTEPGDFQNKTHASFCHEGIFYIFYIP